MTNKAAVWKLKDGTRWCRRCKQMLNKSTLNGTTFYTTPNGIRHPLRVCPKDFKHIERYIDKMGYIVVYEPSSSEATTNGWVREHRSIMARHLGRPLGRHEHIHHKDGNKQNNTIENLILISDAQHMKIHNGNPCHRSIGEPNPLVSCSCGCGAVFPKYDSRGRPRKQRTKDAM